MMIVIDLVTIYVEKLKWGIELSLKREFTKLISINLLMVLYLAISYLDSC